MSEVKTDKVSSITTNGDITLDPNGTGAVVVDAGHSLGVGTATPESFYNLADDIVLGTGSGGRGLTIYSGSSDSGYIGFNDTASASMQGFIQYNHNGDYMAFAPNGSEKVRIDSSGILLVGKTASAENTAGTELNANGYALFVRDGGRVAMFNRTSSDGEVVRIAKNGTTVGQLKVTDGDNFSIDCTSTNHSGLTFGTANILPRVGGANNDGNVDLGGGSNRFLNIYATNGTIQTSDETEKQDIASLTSAEITAAKVISKLFKTFKWRDRVSEEGDAARTHTGVIAQEVQTAMTDAGLNAADYAFWCSDTWWEADETYTDDEGAEQTRTRQYHVEDEAPEGATQRTRLGVRYPELLAFVGAATEQRLADIETRLTALEAE